MDTLTFVVELVAAIAWPITVLTVIFLLRKQLRRLLPNLVLFRYRDLELEFGEEIERLETQADEENLPPSSLELNAEPAERSVPVRLASISPRAAISEAWRELEHSMRNVLANMGQAVPENTYVMIREISEQQFISLATATMLDHLRHLRNEAVHASDTDLTEKSALDYIRLASRIKEKLDSVQT